jgi:hypothetical protein
MRESSPLVTGTHGRVGSSWISKSEASSSAVNLHQRARRRLSASKSQACGHAAHAQAYSALDPSWNRTRKGFDAVRLTATANPCPYKKWFNGRLAAKASGTLSPSSHRKSAAAAVPLAPPCGLDVSAAARGSDRGSADAALCISAFARSLAIITSVALGASGGCGPRQVSPSADSSADASPGGASSVWRASAVAGASAVASGMGQRAPHCG